MPDLKITQMTSATSVTNADVLALVQGLANLKVTRPIYFAAVAGEEIRLRTPNSTVGMDNFENVIVNVANGKTIVLSGPSTSLIAAQIGATTGFTIDNTSITFTAPSVTVSFSAAGGVNIQTDGTVPLFMGAATIGGLAIDPTLGVVLLAQPGAELLVGNLVGNIIVHSTGSIVVQLPAGVPMDVPYQTGNATNWSTALPSSWEDAINRIADFLFSRFGPIP